LVIAHGGLRFFWRGLVSQEERIDGSIHMTIETFLNLGNSLSLRASNIA
jgi:hypothetical protein